MADPVLRSDITVLPDELVQLLLNSLFSISDEDVLNFCQTNKQFSKVCRDSDFWYERAKFKYGEDAPIDYSIGAKEAYFKIPWIIKRNDFKASGMLPETITEVSYVLDRVSNIYSLREIKYIARCIDIRPFGKPKSDLVNMIHERVAQSLG